MIRFSWSLVDDDGCQINVKTPLVQVGTFHRLTAAIFVLKFDIVSGDVDTIEEDGVLYSDDRFLLKNASFQKTPKDSAAAFSAELGVLMESLLQENQDPDFIFREKDIEPPGARQFFGVKPEIVFQDQGSSLTEFYIETTARTGLLYHLTRILYQQNINIVRARIRTNKSGIAEDTFYLQFENTCLGPERAANLERLITGGAP